MLFQLLVPVLPLVRYEFVPECLFLGSLFGYLSVLIIIKWVTGSVADLYHVMIYMFLDPTAPLGGNQLFWGQGALQVGEAHDAGSVAWACWFPSWGLWDQSCAVGLWALT